MPAFIFVFNVQGVAFIVLTVIASALLSQLVPGSAPRWVGGLVIALTAIAIDGGYRLRRMAEMGPRCLVAVGAGGHVWFIPIWVFGVLIAVASFLPDRNAAVPGERMRNRPPVVRASGR